jgi:hypothetical protein
MAVLRAPDEKVTGGNADPGAIELQPPRRKQPSA